MHPNQIKAKSDSYATPLKIYNDLNDEFNFNFDPCPYFDGEISADKDGLLIDWGTRSFVNPPYSHPLKQKFIRKAIEESKKGKLCVMLVPVTGTSSHLFHDHVLPNLAEPIRFYRGRIRFEKIIDGVRVPCKSPIQDNMLLVFDGTKNEPDYNSPEYEDGMRQAEWVLNFENI